MSVYNFTNVQYLTSAFTSPWAELLSRRSPGDHNQVGWPAVRSKSISYLVFFSIVPVRLTISRLPGPLSRYSCMPPACRHSHQHVQRQAPRIHSSLSSALSCALGVTIICADDEHPRSDENYRELKCKFAYAKPHSLLAAPAHACTGASTGSR